MKKIILAFTILLTTIHGYTQMKLPAIDKSPMDMAYYPANYPVLKIQDKLAEPLVARVLYSRPQKNNRKIFGELIEFGKVWRLGANEATEIEFFQNVKVGEARIKKGRYTLYAIPSMTEWTVIINKENDTWGSFKYDEKKDVARIKLPVQKQPVPAENFVMTFSKSEPGFVLVMSWDDSLVSMPITP